MGVCLAVCELNTLLFLNRLKVDLKLGSDFRKLMFAKEFSC